MLEDDPGPVVQRLILGERLRALREAGGIGLDEANADLGWYRGKLSKIEMGTLGVSEKELSVLLSRYGVHGPDAEQVRQLGIEARRRAAPERVSDWAKQYLPLERASAEIRMVFNEVPGLLQTKGYAKAQLSRSPVVTAADLDSMASAREERGARLLQSSPPNVWAVLGEEALVRQVGERDEMNNQLKRLRELSELPNVSLRIVPFSAGSYAALSCPFTLLWIEQARASIAYVETMTGADYVKTTGVYMIAFEQAMSGALAEDDTLTLLDQYINRS